MSAVFKNSGLQLTEATRGLNPLLKRENVFELCNFQEYSPMAEKGNIAVRDVSIRERCYEGGVTGWRIGDATG